MNVNKCYILSIVNNNVLKKETAQWIATVLAELLEVRQRIPIEGSVSISIRRFK